MISDDKNMAHMLKQSSSQQSDRFKAQHILSVCHCSQSFSFTYFFYRVTDYFFFFPWQTLQIPCSLPQRRLCSVRLQLEGEMQLSSRSGNFPEHL